MKLLTKDTDYAVRALIALGINKDNFISAREISKTQNIPYQFLRRILQKLSQHNLIESKEGKMGGVRLIGNPKKISVLDLIKIFQRNLELSDCMFRKKICPNRGTCVLRTEIKCIEDTVITEFKKLTIATLLNKVMGFPLLNK
jgi:Rrf2 family transcriptional regulator, cysteine metabolism repressor